MKSCDSSLYNCPIDEQTADGIKVGRCWHYIGPEGYCPRHGDVRKYIGRLPTLTAENDMRKDKGQPLLGET